MSIRVLDLGGLLSEDYRVQSVIRIAGFSEFLCIPFRPVHAISGKLYESTTVPGFSGFVEIVMLEKLDCILSKSATRPYIYEYKCECVHTHLCIDPSGFRPTAISGHTRLTSGHTRLISGHKKTETYHAIGLTV